MTFVRSSGLCLGNQPTEILREDAAKPAEKKPFIGGERQRPCLLCCVLRLFSDYTHISTCILSCPPPSFPPELCGVGQPLMGRKLGPFVIARSGLRVQVRSFFWTTKRQCADVRTATDGAAAGQMRRAPSSMCVRTKQDHVCGFKSKFHRTCTKVLPNRKVFM